MDISECVKESDILEFKNLYEAFTYFIMGNECFPSLMQNENDLGYPFMYKCAKYEIKIINCLKEGLKFEDNPYVKIVIKRLKEELKSGVISDVYLSFYYDCFKNEVNSNGFIDFKTNLSEAYNNEEVLNLIK